MFVCAELIYGSLDRTVMSVGTISEREHMSHFETVPKSWFHSLIGELFKKKKKKFNFK